MEKPKGIEKREAIDSATVETIDYKEVQQRQYEQNLKLQRAGHGRRKQEQQRAS